LGIDGHEVHTCAVGNIVQVTIRCGVNSTGFLGRTERQRAESDQPRQEAGFRSFFFFLFFRFFFFFDCRFTRKTVCKRPRKVAAGNGGSCENIHGRGIVPRSIASNRLWLGQKRYVHLMRSRNGLISVMG